MAPRPIITVGISFLNAETTLFDSIRSVLAQSFHDWELLLVDDGSTDRSLEIAKSSVDPRVHVFSDGHNRGLVNRLNQMIDTAKGTYFARMDADDVMHPLRLQKQRQFLWDFPETEVLGTAAYIIDERNVPYGIRADHPSVQSASIRSGFVHPTVIGKTEWFRRYHYDPDYVRAEDMELWMRADSTTKFARMLEPLLFYRDPREFNRGKYKQSMRTVRRIMRKHAKGALLETAVAVARSYVGEALITALAAVGLESFLIRRRNRPCTEAELTQALETLAALERVPVPVGAAPINFQGSFLGELG